MIRVGIVTLYTENTINYGNCLQAYALNYLVRKLLTHEDTVYTLKIKDLRINRVYTKKVPLRIRFKRLIKRIYRSLKGTDIKFPGKQQRRKAFRDFGKKHICQYEESFSYPELKRLDFDIIIAGSDVIWGQTEYMLNRVRFLKFETAQRFKKVSYAASFARDWIPEENIGLLQAWLSEFSDISVRENSSVKLLSSIGIHGAVHVLDPTLLLTFEEWCKIEEKPSDYKEEKYVFVYLLGEDRKQHLEISRFCRRSGLQIITVPCASGETADFDKNFGDIKIWDCSPQNWIWLIHHAEYVITDSFHGLIFSTIFRKRFLILKRHNSEIGNRQIDYLKTIGQEDKMVEISDIDFGNDFCWDYDQIYMNLEKKKEYSLAFLKNALEVT